MLLTGMDSLLELKSVSKNDHLGVHEKLFQSDSFSRDTLTCFNHDKIVFHMISHYVLIFQVR